MFTKTTLDPTALRTDEAAAALRNARDVAVNHMRTPLRYAVIEALCCHDLQEAPSVGPSLIDAPPPAEGQRLRSPAMRAVVVQQPLLVPAALRLRHCGVTSEAHPAHELLTEEGEKRLEAHWASPSAPKGSAAVADTVSQGWCDELQTLVNRHNALCGGTGVALYDRSLPGSKAPPTLTAVHVGSEEGWQSRLFRAAAASSCLLVSVAEERYSGSLRVVPDALLARGVSFEALETELDRYYGGRAISALDPDREEELMRRPWLSGRMTRLLHSLAILGSRGSLATMRIVSTTFLIPRLDLAGAGLGVRVAPKAEPPIVVTTEAEG